MAKEYVPSGYQIINIDIDINEDEELYVKDSDDKLVLIELLKNNMLQKPILCHIHDIENGYDFTAFAISTKSFFIRVIFSITSMYEFLLDGENIIVTFTE